MENALQLYPQLAESMWRVCSIRIAVPLLMSHPAYNSMTKEKVRLFCEKSTMACLPPYGQTMFQPPKNTAELVLIQGKVTYMVNRDSYEGPCVLPNAEGRILLNYDGCPPKILQIYGEANGGKVYNISREKEVVELDLDAEGSYKVHCGGTEVKFRGKPANRALEPLPEKYKEKRNMAISPSCKVNNDATKLVEVSEK